MYVSSYAFICIKYIAPPIGGKKIELSYDNITCFNNQTRPFIMWDLPNLLDHNVVAWEARTCIVMCIEIPGIAGVWTQHDMDTSYKVPFFFFLEKWGFFVYVSILLISNWSLGCLMLSFSVEWQKIDVIPESQTPKQVHVCSCSYISSTYSQE